ncbi:hypothetical protein L2E82_17790 [Cichorium intybus]|uniref:Uncharacterized protein n=1 Tax=Cichorium intybus TaxID=13427 RepID=A0ACB9F8Y5_CICIN|nr:hypothetical protein L2E82_17790 [Cichorium intybus]
MFCFLSSIDSSFATFFPLSTYVPAERGTGEVVTVVYVDEGAVPIPILIPLETRLIMLYVDSDAMSLVGMKVDVVVVVSDNVTGAKMVVAVIVAVVNMVGRY